MREYAKARRARIKDEMGLMKATTETSWYKSALAKNAEASRRYEKHTELQRWFWGCNI